MTAPDFDDVYDAQIVDLIDAHRARPARPGALATPTSDQALRPAESPRSRVRRGVAGAALATALVTGVRESLDDTSHEELEEIEDGVFGGPDQFVTLFFVPNDPHSTRAIVRPWLHSPLEQPGSNSPNEDAGMTTTRTPA